MRGIRSGVGSTARWMYEQGMGEAGVKTTKPGERSFGARGTSTRWFYFQDPDGNVLEARSYEDEGGPPATP